VKNTVPDSMRRGIANLQLAAATAAARLCSFRALVGPAREGESMSNPFTDALRSCMRPRPLMFALVLAGLLDACGGDGSGRSAGAMTSTAAAATTSSAAGAPAPAQGGTGHYVGAVKIADTTYFGDAVVTEDGVVRLYIGGPYDDGGELQTARPDSSEQFVGSLQMRDAQWSGSGIIIGQECAIKPANRFCAQPAPAEFSANVSSVSGCASARLQGKIQLVTSGGTETWSLDLGLWGDDGPLEPGQFQEVLAEFASSDVIVTLDGSERLFFQSSGSSCIGNGTLAPHSAGPAGISDMTLLMESCSGAYAYLNGTYGGLALATPSSCWDYDSVLRIWLSKGSGEGSPAALTMLGELL
jgi:hypothetical protein